MSKIVSIIERRLKKAQELREDVMSRVEVNKNLYKGILLTDDSYEWDYNLVDQHVFPLIRNYISRTNLAHLEVELRARKPEDYEKKDVNQGLINWELNEFHKTLMMIRMMYSAYVAGRGYLKTGWLYQPKVVINQDGQKRTILRDIVNRADAKFVRFNDIIIPNRNIPTLKEQPYVFELIQKRVGEMLDENEREEYWDKKWLEKLRKSGVSNKLLDFQMEKVTDDDLKEDIAFKSAYVPLACMHTLEGDVLYIPLNDKNNDEPVNKIQENRYWHGHYPYIDFAVFPEDDEYDSMGVVDAVADLQITATELLNQTLTNVRQINNSMWIKGGMAAETPDWQFSSRPNGVITVAGDIQQVQQVRPIDNTMSSLRMSQDLMGKIEKVGGISSLYSSGVPGAKINQTARGAQIIDQNIETNMQLILDILGETVVKELADHFLELNAQYITEDQSFYVTGKRGVRELVSVSPEMVTANFNVFPNTDKFVKQTPASRQASLQNLLNVLSGQAAQGNIMLDLVPLAEALIDSYPDMTNVSDVVSSVDEKSKRDIISMERGQLPDIKVRDPHLPLIQLVSMHLGENMDGYTPEVTAVFTKYIEKHMEFIQKEKEIQAMSQPQLPQIPGPQSVGEGTVPESTGVPEPNMKSYDLGNIVA